MTKQQLHEMLEDQYFEELANEGIDFVDIDDAGTSRVKERFIISDNEMAQYLGYEDFAEYMQEELRIEGIMQPDWLKELARLNLRTF